MAKARTESRVEVRSPNAPGYVSTVDATKYEAMRRALMKVIPKKAPGLTQKAMMEVVLPHLPEDSFPGGEKAGWWVKCVQLDLETKGVLTRDTSSKPLRWTRAK